MKKKKIFNYNNLKINEDETLFTNHRKIMTTMRILKDEQKQFPTIHEKITNIERTC